MTKSRWAAGGLLALVFALGALVGGAATMMADRETHRTDRKSSHGSFVDFLTDELKLSADQSAKVSAILERHEPAMDSIWSIIRPQFEAERHAVRAEIKTLLSADQIKLYEALIARRDSMHRARGASHGSR